MKQMGEDELIALQQAELVFEGVPGVRSRRNIRTAFVAAAIEAKLVLEGGAHNQRKVRKGKAL